METLNDTLEGKYEPYRGSKIPEGYTAYGDNGQFEFVYDEYEYDHEKSSNAERLKRNLCKKLKLCWCDMGRIIKIFIYTNY